MSRSRRCTFNVLPWYSIIRGQRQTEQQKGKDVRAELVQKLDDLEDLVENMDVPEFKRRSVRWLDKNLGVRNTSHPDYEKAKGLIKELLSHGVG